MGADKDRIIFAWLLTNIKNFLQENENCPLKNF